MRDIQLGHLLILCAARCIFHRTVTIALPDCCVVGGGYVTWRATWRSANFLSRVAGDTRMYPWPRMTQGVPAKGGSMSGHCVTGDRHCS